MTDNDSWIGIGSRELSARIDPMGAQLSVLRDGADRDLLWDGDATFWNGRAPLLFPIVGALAAGTYRLGDRSYALSRHGFARGKRFEVMSVAPSLARLRLKADDQTRALYPFDFELQVSFEIAAATLTVTSSVGNGGHAPMPASFGYHPAFRWPLPYGAARAQHAIEFEAEEPAPIRRLNSEGLVTSVLHPTPVRSQRLQLDDALFREDVVILDAVRSQSVSYGAQSGPKLTVEFPHTPYLGFWSKPGAPFICIEPWHGMADPAGFAGDFTAKPGIFLVPPGGQRQLIMRVTLSNA